MLSAHALTSHLGVQAYMQALDLLINLVSLQTAFVTLDEAIQVSCRITVH